MAKIELLLPVALRQEIHDEQGIALIASYLRENGHEVSMHAVSSSEEQLAGIKWSEYDLVGITSYHHTLSLTYEIAEYIKKTSQKTAICIGGYSATYYYKEILENCPYIDFIMAREGELTFLDICNRIDQGIEYWDVQGIVYRKDGQIIANEDRECIKDLNALPFAAKDIYRANHLRLIQISTSRGCTNNCSFCYSHTYFDPKIKWRGRSVENVHEEVKKIVNEDEFSAIYFNNASFEDSLPPFDFAKRFSAAIIESGLDISYCVNFRANFYRFCDDEFIENLKKSGLVGVFLGIEAFNEHDLKVYNKHTSVKDNLESIAFFDKHGIGLDIGFINFNPYSTWESLRENEKHLYATGYLASLDFVSSLRAYRGTAICKRLEEEGHLRESNLDYRNYEFLTPGVGELLDFIKSLFVGEYAAILGTMHDYVMYHNQLYTHLKHVCRKNESFIEIVEQYNAGRKGILRECGEYCHFWYSKLLDIGEEGWNEEKARRFVDEEKVLEKMAEFDQRLKQEYFRFIRKARKIDKEVVEKLLLYAVSNI